MGYIGDDGRWYENPCTSAADKPKQRWPNEQAAWFVVGLIADGKWRARGVPERMIPYRCPKCLGYHLTRVRTDEHAAVHEAGLAALRQRIADKSLQNANKSGHNTSDGLT